MFDPGKIIDAIVRENPKFTRDQAGIMVRDYLPEIIARYVVGMYWEKVAADHVRKNHSAQLRAAEVNPSMIREGMCRCEHSQHAHSPEGGCCSNGCDCKGFVDVILGLTCHTCGHSERDHNHGEECKHLRCDCSEFAAKCPECGGRMKDEGSTYRCHDSHDLGARKVFVAKRSLNHASALTPAG